jgi:hypothetical protein
MNNKGRSELIGLSLMMAVFVFALVLFATIDPFKQFLDDARDTTSLNCKGTSTFNQTAFDNDNDNVINRLTRRPTCFVTGLYMVYFIGAFLIASLTWMVSNWRKLAR